MFEPLTHAEALTIADLDDALDRGARDTDRAWVLSDRDVWHANPFYVGPPVPHPESSEADCLRAETFDHFTAPDPEEAHWALVLSDPRANRRA